MKKIGYSVRFFVFFLCSFFSILHFYTDKSFIYAWLGCCSTSAGWCQPCDGRLPTNCSGTCTSSQYCQVYTIPEFCCDYGECVDNPCSCNWNNWSICYSNWAGCIKDRACSCSPSGCGSCSGDNWTYCTASEKGCSNQDCPTYAGYPGGTVRDGTLSSDCSCGTKTCPAICNPSNPDTPVLSAPASGTTVNLGSSVNLDWNAISSWGNGCPQDNDYEVCVMSNNSTCDYINLTNQGNITTNYNWTPTTGDKSVYWKIRAHNGSNTATSATRTLCVENQLCDNPQCGEDKLCGGTCSNKDNDAPDVPAFTNANNRIFTSMPIGFTWTTGGTKTDYYNTSLDSATGVNVGNVLTVSNISVGKTGWHNLKVQSVNTSCGTDESIWSDPWSAFCYDTEVCNSKCGQARACSAACGTGDLGTPAVPIPIWPISVGTTIACDATSIGLRWSAVNDGLADGYAISLRHQSDYNKSLFWNTVGLGITGITIPRGTGNTGIGMSGNYKWYLNSYNNTCNSVPGSIGTSTYYGDPWAAGWFCKECEQCTKKCDQPRNCNNRVCTGEDNGNPLAPTPVSPTGTPLNPAIFPLNTASITFDWSDVPLLTDYYQVYVIGATNYSNLNVSKSTSNSAFGPFGVAGLYHWYVWAMNDTCNGINGGIDVGATSTHQYFRINTTPVLNPPPTNFLVLQNSENVPVPVDIGSSNHICQPIFTEEASPPADRRQIKLVVTASDADGGSEISSIAVRLNVGTSANSAGGVTGQWSFISPPSCTTSGNNKTCTFHMNLLDNLNNPSLYNLEARVVDIWGATSGWVDSGRDLKIWDCLVDTSGSLYEAEDGKPVCANPLSYNKKIEPEIGFNSIVFDNTSQSQPVDMTETIPANYGPPDSLVWGRTYLPLINGGVIGNLDGTLLATNRVTRIIDTGGVGTTYCPGSQFRIGNGPQALISAYSINPSAQIDFSYIRDQEGWYQVVGAGVKGRTGVQSGVPVTALQKALTWSGVGNTNGLVSSNDLMNNINGCSESTCLWGNPNNWYLEQNTNDNDIYNYNYFYNNFYVKAGVGVTGTGWSGRPAEGVYFVKNGLTIDTGSSLADLNTKTMLVVVNGGITIAPNVKRLDGIYIADGIISVGGTSVDQLNINGMLYAGGSVRLYRSFTNKTDNNTAPAVKVNYSPGLIFNLPPEIMKVLSGWREE